VNPEVQADRIAGEAGCQSGLTIGEVVMFTLFLLWVGYYMWLVNSLVVRFEENEGQAIVPHDTEDFESENQNPM
jgi:hypothetical protein